MDELDVGDAGIGGVAAGEVEHLFRHVDADGPSSGRDAASGDQDVGAGPRAEVEDDLAGVEVGDGGGHPAAQRGREGGGGGAFGGVGVVELGAEDEVALLVGGARPARSAGFGFDRPGFVVIATG